MGEVQLDTRAVLKRIEPATNGTPWAPCVWCALHDVDIGKLYIKFAARKRANVVICNVYVDGKWDRVEHYHEACYLEAGEPHGAASDGRT